MIINLLISVFLTIFGAILSFLPTVTIADIAYIGPTLSETLTIMISTWNAFMVTFPYAETLWNVFIYVILPFEFTMLIAKFFLGQRLPAHTN